MNRRAFLRTTVALPIAAALPVWAGIPVYGPFTFKLPLHPVPGDVIILTQGIQDTIMMSAGWEVVPGTDPPTYSMIYPGDAHGNP